MSEAWGFQHVASKQICLLLCLLWLAPCTVLWTFLGLFCQNLFDTILHLSCLSVQVLKHTDAYVTHFPPQHWCDSASWVKSCRKSHPPQHWYGSISWVKSHKSLTPHSPAWLLLPSNLPVLSHLRFLPPGLSAGVWFLFDGNNSCQSQWYPAWRPVSSPGLWSTLTFTCPQ